MSTTPATPDLTINSSAAELKAALEAQATPVETTPQPAVAPAPVPPAPPAEPQPYTVSETPEGVEIKLETGAVYKGKSWAEAASALAKGKVEADKTIHQFRQQTQPQQPVQPVQPEQPTETPEEAATREWVVKQFADYLGVPVGQLKQVTEQMFQTTQQAAISVAWTDFTQACPDYADTPENAAAIVDYLPQDVIAQRRPPSVDELKTAHAVALYNKRYAGAVQPQTPRVPVPPAMPTAGVSQGAGDPNYQTMPLSELKKLAFGQ